MPKVHSIGQTLTPLAITVTSPRIVNELVTSKTHPAEQLHASRKVLEESKIHFNKLPMMARKCSFCNPMYNWASQSIAVYTLSIAHGEIA